MPQLNEFICNIHSLVERSDLTHYENITNNFPDMHEQNEKYKCK